MKRELGETLLGETLFYQKLGETFWVKRDWVKRYWANCYHTYFLSVSFTGVVLGEGLVRWRYSRCSRLLSQGFRWELMRYYLYLKVIQEILLIFQGFTRVIINISRFYKRYYKYFKILQEILSIFQGFSKDIIYISRFCET